MTARFATFDFSLHGDVFPLQKAASTGHKPTRPMGGWLMTYAKIGADGGLIPTVDREGQIMEAASELGQIDWTPYLQNGLWNDTHVEQIIVGVPTRLEFHDASSALALDHRKVGYWTEGHLFDRDDPDSWRLYTDHEPTEQDLKRSDYFWALAHGLEGMPRPLGFSAHGSMALSPCGKRITWCQVTQAAVCELPQNPDATAEMLKGSPLQLLAMRKAVPRVADPCARCKCPPWACSKAQMTKATPAVDADPAVRTAPPNVNYVPTGHAHFDAIVISIMHQFSVPEDIAKKWVSQYVLQQSRTQ